MFFIRPFSKSLQGHGARRIVKSFLPVRIMKKRTGLNRNFGSVPGP
jgi:hypothetical protein